MSEQIPGSPVPSAVPSTPLPAPTAPLSAIQTWILAVTKPGERTFAQIANSPRARASTAFAWIFLAALVQAVVTGLVGSTTETQLLRDLGSAQALPVLEAGSRLFEALSGAVGTAAVSISSFAIFIGLMNLIARAFGGKATFAQMAYTIAAISVPITLLEAVLTLPAFIPFLGFCSAALVFVAALYGLVLDVVAVKGVHQISWGGSIVSALLLPIVLIGCIAVATIAVLIVLGPVIGNTFSTINSSLQSVP